MAEEDPFYPGEQLDPGRRQQPAQTRPMDGLSGNSVGGQEIIESAGTVNVLKMSGSDPGEALVITLGVELSPDPSLVAGAAYTLTALIEWGSGGAWFKAEVDWDQGAQVCIYASSVKVSAVYTGVGPAVAVSASVAYGNSSKAKAKRTQAVGSVAAGAYSNTGIPLKVPNFATGLRLQCTVPGGALANIRWVSHGTLPSTFISIVPWDTLREEPVSIPLGAHYFIIENTGPVANNFSALFELAV